jgi:hypothetical protein
MHSSGCQFLIGKEFVMRSDQNRRLQFRVPFIDESDGLEVVGFGIDQKEAYTIYPLGGWKKRVFDLVLCVSIFCLLCRYSYLCHP